jgi:hypothetical protein
MIKLSKALHGAWEQSTAPQSEEKTTTGQWILIAILAIAFIGTMVAFYLTAE